MSYSNSSLNTFASCMALYKHKYILHSKPDKAPSPHLLFGTMAHDTLYKAGTLRDEANDNVIDKGEYKTVIPSEVLYNDLKNEFGINSWYKYFMPVIKQTAEYEIDIVNRLKDMDDGPVTIEREVKLQLEPSLLADMGYYGLKEPLLGIIDCLIYTHTHCVILDYKFSTSRKTQEDFDNNSQLMLYSLLVHRNYDIPLHNIEVGYIDIPKTCFAEPALLSNGLLSRAKSQNVSQEMYEKAVLAVHGEDPYYNCKEGGYYYDCWKALGLNKAAYLSLQYLDLETYTSIVEDVLATAKMIEQFKEQNLPFLRKYDAYSCKSCEYLSSCKPWIYQIFKEV